MKEKEILKEKKESCEKNNNIIKFSGPLLKDLILHITNNCNLECLHCYIKDLSDFSEPTTQQIKNIIEQAAKIGVMRIHITGGEPFLRDDLNEILNKLIESKICLRSIFTNGLLLEDHIEFIKQVKNNFDTTFYISIDGLQDNHNKFRKNEKSFQLAIKNIKRLEKLGVKIVINTILNSFNKHDMFPLFNELKELKISRWRIDTGFLLGNWQKNKVNFGLNPEEEFKIYKKIVAIWNKNEKPFELELGHFLRYMYNKIWNPTYNLNSYACCKVYQNACVIWPNGDITSCGMLYDGHVVGNIFSKNLSNIWLSNDMRYYKNLKIKDIINKKCLKCEHLSVCGLGCRANSYHRIKKYEASDPEICEIFLTNLYNTFKNSIKNYF